MIQTYIYAGIMIIILIGLFVKKTNIMGTVLWSLFTMVSFFSVIAMKAGLVKSNVTLLPYIFLIVVYLIVFYPFITKSAEFAIEKVTYDLNIKYVIFAYVFIIAGVISISYYLPLVKQLMLSGDWNQNRSDLYSGAFNFSYTWYQYYALQFVGYTRILGIIVGFIFLRNDQKSFLGWSSVIVGSLVCVLSAMSQSSRGAIVNIVLLVLVIFFFFYRDMANSKKRVISILVFAGTMALLPYVIEVTVSRFTSTGALDSIISYFGQPPVVFNYGVTPVYKHMYGLYAWGNLFGAAPVSPSDIGGSWGTGFYSFVGWMYIDWGYIGTIIVSIIIAYITYRIIAKETYDIADLFLIFFIYYTLLQGVFVIGRDYCYNIFMTLVIYGFVKIFFDKYTFIIGSIRL